MKLSRMLYPVLVLVSLSLAFFFYYQDHQKDKELFQYQKLIRLSKGSFTEIEAELIQSKEDLDNSLQKLDESVSEIERLNAKISSLAKDNFAFQEEILALKEERKQLQTKVSSLLDERSGLEQKFLSLMQKFHSLEELKKAIKIVKIERRQKQKIRALKRRLAKIEMLKALDEVALREGNRGFLCWQGESTFRPTRVRVELEPIGKWSYREVE